MIVLSCFILGEYFGIRQELRIDQLCGVRLGINLIVQEMSYNLRTLESSCGIASDKLDSPVGDIFGAFGRNLEEGADSCDSWRLALEKTMERTFLSEEDADLLSDLGKIFVSFDADKQEKNIAALNKRIDERVGRLSGESVRTRKLGRSFSVMAGLLLVVILL